MGHGSQREINHRGAAVPDVKELRAPPATQAFRGRTFDGRGATGDGDGGAEGDIARDHAGIPPGRGAAGEGGEGRNRGRGQEPGLREELAERLLGLAGVVQRGCSALRGQEFAQKKHADEQKNELKATAGERSPRDGPTPEVRYCLGWWLSALCDEPSPLEGVVAREIVPRH